MMEAGDVLGFELPGGKIVAVWCRNFDAVGPVRTATQQEWQNVSESNHDLECSTSENEDHARLEFAG